MGPLRSSSAARLSSAWWLRRSDGPAIGCGARGRPLRRRRLRAGELDLLDDEQPGAGGRRAGHRQDRRLDDLHDLPEQAVRRDGRRWEAAARRLARPRQRRLRRPAAAPRKPRDRHLRSGAGHPPGGSRLGGAAADRVVALLRLRRPDHAHRSRRARPLGDEGDADDDGRRTLRRCAPERLDRTGRDLVGPARDRRAAVPEQDERLDSDPGVPRPAHRAPLLAFGRLVHRFAGRCSSRVSGCSRSSPSTSTAASALPIRML